MTTADEELVSRLQEHLATIRKAAGWSGERLAMELGVTKQTVSSLETGKTQMTKMHYLAIRSVFNNEIAVNENEDLAKIIQLFVDQPMASELEKAQDSLNDGDEGAEKKRGAIAKQSAIIGATAFTAALIPATSAMVPALNSLARQVAKSITKSITK